MLQETGNKRVSQPIWLRVVTERMAHLNSLQPSFEVVRSALFGRSVKQVHLVVAQLRRRTAPQPNGKGKGTVYWFPRVWPLYRYGCPAAAARISLPFLGVAELCYDLSFH